jgi:predicted phosphodiesterase
MAGKPRLKTEIIKTAIRRFGHLPIQTIARYLIAAHKDLFEGDLEKVRSSIRYYTGTNGKRDNSQIPDKSLFRSGPVPLPSTWRKKRSSYYLPPGTWLVLSDIHIPFHEPDPLQAAVACGQAEKVTGIFINGDFQDCASISFWPTAIHDFNMEVEATIDTLDWLRQEFSTQKFVYKPGNHEYRLPRYYVSHAPELIGSPLSAMETILGFEQRNITFLDYHQIVQAGDLPILHGHEVRYISHAVNPARGLFLRTKTFSACSHCHSTSMHTPKTIHGELLTTWSFGCLCDLNPEYNPYGNDWNWGFAIINVEKNGDFEVVNRRILPSGKVV